MITFAIGIEDPFEVPIQRPHDADPGQHRRPAAIIMTLGGSAGCMILIGLN